MKLEYVVYEVEIKDVDIDNKRMDILKKLLREVATGYMKEIGGKVNVDIVEKKVKGDK